jgi:LssY C-terminus
MGLLKVRLFRVLYTPRPEEQSFLARAAVQSDDEFAVRVSVLDDRESERFFGVPLARRGIQPVWLKITNNSARTYRLRLASLDPNYYPPLEAAFVCHFHIGRRLAGFGLLAFVFLPLLILLPFKVFSAWSANRRMNAYFQEHGIGCGVIRPGNELSGFVFTTHDAGTKQVAVKLLGAPVERNFAFSIPVPGLKVDHGRERFAELGSLAETVECDEAELRKRLAALPRTTTNSRRTREGDPLNLVVIGDFETILRGFGARWDETEVISLGSCWRMLKAFLLGSRDRYSPVSALYVAGRSQDVALQRTRHTINERLHLRLWMTPLRFQGKPVWIGQVSRDIGVRFTLRTWNLTTHKIGPNVDEARDYVIDDLIEAERVALVGFCAGAGAAERAAPRRNLTGDPYFTDGLRAVVVFSETRTTPKFLDWE